MIKASNIRKVIKEVGAENYGNWLREQLGVEVTTNNPNGQYPVKYNPAKAQYSTSEFSLRELAEEFLGQSFVSGLHNPKMELHLREALSGVSPSTFGDINAFNQTIGGLIEVRVLAGYNLPRFIGRELVEVQPTRVNGGKMIGMPNIKAPQFFTNPGEEMPSIGMQQRWALAQPNVKYAQKLAIDRESVVYDLTGELLATAESMGMTLALGQECMIACQVMGLTLTKNQSNMLPPGFTGNNYIYDDENPLASAANIYQTVAGTGASAKYNYINSISNQLIDWKNFQSTQAQLNLQREFETNFPILADFDTAIVSPQVEYNARVVLHSTSVAPFSNGGTTDFPTNMTFAANPIPQRIRLYSSPIWNKLLVDNQVSQTNADIYWYAGDPRKSFVWREVWPMQVLQANPLSSEMLQSDIVNSYYASWYGVAACRDPRYMIRSTN